MDILTGQHIVSRVDLLEDVGQSMSPLVDIGQIEGAFIMGLGYYTTEEIIHNYEGKILTDRTWNYRPPGAKDIPVDFRVRLKKNNPNPAGVLHSKGKRRFLFYDNLGAFHNLDTLDGPSANGQRETYV